MSRLFLHKIQGKIQAVSHRNGFRAEYSGRNLAEYSAETVSVKIMGFGYRIFDPLAHIWLSRESMSVHIFGNFA